MKGKLFATDLPERSWVKFPAEGFSKPVTGVVFRGGNMLPGMPLGAIGTGFISLGTDGTLDYVSTIFNAFLERRDAAAEAQRKAEDLQSEHLIRFGADALYLAQDGNGEINGLGHAMSGYTRG